MAEVGRPSVVTPDVVLKLEQAFAIDATVEEACSYADIARNTFYVYLEKNPEFKDRIDELRQRPILKARQTITRALDDANHAFRYLEKKRRKEFGNSIDVTTDGEKIVSDTKELKDITHKLNELYRRTGIPSDGESASALGNKA